MKPEEILHEINCLPMKQRLEVVAAVLTSVCDEEQGVASGDRRSQKKLAALGRLRGLLKFQGGPPTDEEVKDMITDYLAEKYSLRDA